MTDKAIVLLSGGLNSYVAAKLLVDRFKGEIVEAVTLNYGQEHCHEVDAAGELAESLGIPWTTLSPEVMWETTDRLTIGLADKLEKSGLNRSFWDGRRLMIHLIGAIRAHSLGADCVVTGAIEQKADDEITALKYLEMSIGQDGMGVVFWAPFQSAELGHAFRVAHKLGVWDEAVLNTMDCVQPFSGLDPHEWGVGCGECQGCKARIEAHKAALATIRSEAYEVEQ
jgi:7-cyano-7-deazaguanine synthase in queuosine biosynthesis